MVGVIFQPGNYYLNEPIVVNNDNQVLLGIGMPVLIWTNPQPSTGYANGGIGIYIQSKNAG
jgi:hypothetical protein